MLTRRMLMTAVVAGVALAAAGRPAGATATEARAFIDKLAETAMSTVAVPGISDEERNDRFRTLFVTFFDLPEIGKLVMGRYWRIATPAEQQEFLKLFEEIQVLTWAKRFKDYSGETMDFVAVTPEGELGYSVDTLIKRQKLNPIAVNWIVHKTGDGYRVLDIKVESASMAFTHRSEYTSVIQASGGKVQGLLSAMRRKIAQLQAEQAAAR